MRLKRKWLKYAQKDSFSFCKGQDERVNGTGSYLLLQYEKMQYSRVYLNVEVKKGISCPEYKVTF